MSEGRNQRGHGRQSRGCGVIIAGLAGLATSAAVAQPSRVYLACDNHTDYIWSADRATYRSAFMQMIDYYLDQSDRTGLSPPIHQGRFVMDGSYWLWVYERHRSPAEFERLIGRIKSGHFSAPMTPLVCTMGGVPTEAALRGLYYAGRLERREGIKFNMAVTMENQTQPWGLYSLWAGSGASWSWKGICGCDTRVSSAPREHEIYRALGPDGTGVVMKWNSLFGSNESLGGYAEGRFPAQAVDFVTVNAPFNGFGARWPYSVTGVFGQGWDDLLTLDDQILNTAVSRTNASRTVIVSNEEDFFRDFLATYPPATLPTEQVTYGNEWDVYVASLQEVASSVKRSNEKLRTAEGLAAIASLYEPSFMQGREVARDEAFMNLGIFFEHNFGMINPPTGSAGVNDRIAFQRELATQIKTYVDTLAADGSAWLAAHVAAPVLPVGVTRFVVFNPLSWTRDAAADLPLGGSGPVSVYDVTTGAEVPSQRITVDGAPRLRIWAAGVPSVGYKVFEVRSVAGAAFPPAATVVAAPGSGGQVTVTIPVDADNRDATSNTRTGAVRVFVSGYGPGDRNDYVGNDSENETAAVQFALSLPPGAAITSARLVVRASGSANPGSGVLRVHAFDSGNCPPFVDQAGVDLENFLPLVATTIDWPAPAWPIGLDVQSPDLAPLVQQFVNRPGYAAGAHLGMVIRRGSLSAGSYYGFEDFADAGTSQARLVVTYTDPNAPAPTSDRIVESGRYRVRVTPRGAITSLVDRSRADREFAASIDGRALNDLGPGSASDVLEVESVGPVSVTLRALSAQPVAHTSRVTIYANSDRIDLDNQITQNFSDAHDWSFAYALANPSTWHEEIGAIALAKLSSSPGGSYATQNARYDWLTLNHFTETSGTGGVGVTLSNADGYFFGLGRSMIQTLDTATPQVRALAGGRVVNDGFGLPNQGGDSLFTQRFAVRSRGSYDQAGAMRFALEHQNPLVAAQITATAPVLPPDQQSFLSIDNPRVLLWSLKPAEEGIAPAAPTLAAPGGLVARVWNLDESPQAAVVQLPTRPIGAATLVTHIETNISAAPLTAAGAGLSLARQQIQTVRLTFPCSIDFNADGFLNQEDLSGYLSAFLDESIPPGPSGTSTAPCPGEPTPYDALGYAADFNRDCAFNQEDLSGFLTEYFGQAENPTVCVPG